MRENVNQMWVLITRDILQLSKRSKVHFLFPSPHDSVENLDNAAPCRSLLSFYVEMNKWCLCAAARCGGDSPKVGRKSPPNIDRLESCVIRVAVVTENMISARVFIVTPPLHHPPHSTQDTTNFWCKYNE